MACVRGSTSSRSELCVWMCEAHNRVNRDLGKKEFRCDMKELDARWCAAHNNRMPTRCVANLRTLLPSRRVPCTGATVASGAAMALADG